MSRFDENVDPMRGIRTVILVGFSAGIAGGLCHAVLTGFLFEQLWSDISVWLITIGLAIFVGVFGAILGTFIGLSARMILHGTRISESWWPPIILSSLISASIGLFASILLIGALSVPVG